MIFWLRRGRVPAAPRQATALEYFGAVRMPDYSGWHVYVLPSRLDGHVFYVGQSEDLLRRLSDQARNFREQFDPARVHLVPCRSQDRADLVELEMIEFYNPECNTLGRRAELAARLRKRNKPLRAGSNVPVSLDPSQATG